MGTEELATLGRHQPIGTIEETPGLQRRLGVSLIGECVTQACRLRAGQQAVARWARRIVDGDGSDNAVRRLTEGITAVLDATWPSIRLSEQRLMIDGLWEIPADEGEPEIGRAYRVADKPWRTVTVRKAYRLAQLDGKRGQGESGRMYGVRLEVGHEPEATAAGPRRYEMLLGEARRRPRRWLRRSSC